MDRRVFLSGVFGGITSAGLILAAKPEEIAAFTSPFVRDQPLVVNRPSGAAAQVGQELYNKDGQIVALVQRIEWEYEPVEASMWGGSHKVFVQGMPRVHIQAIGVVPR